MISRERLYIANKKARRRVDALAWDFDIFRGRDGKTITSGQWKDEVHVRYRKTTKCCSQACCGNPRKWFNELTRQEKISNDIFCDFHKAV